MLARISWTRRSFGTPASTGKIRFDGGKFTIVGNDGLILSSLDGITWTTTVPATLGGIGRLASSGTMLVATGSSKGTVLTSPDGAHWTAHYLPDSSVSLTGLAYGNELFVGIGHGNFGDPAAVMTSPDGMSWTQSDLGTYSRLNDIAFGNDAFVIVTGGDTIFTSFDGAFWVPKTLDTRSLNSIVFKDGMFVAAYVEIDRQPLASPFWLPGDIIPFRRRVPQEVPCRIEEGVGDIGFAARLASALRARDVVPLLGARQRGDTTRVGLEVLDLRQGDGQILAVIAGAGMLEEGQWLGFCKRLCLPQGIAPVDAQRTEGIGSGELFKGRNRNAGAVQTITTGPCTRASARGKRG